MKRNPLSRCLPGGLRVLALAGALSQVAGSFAAAPVELLRDSFNASTANTTDLNVDLARQSGTLAPVSYVLAGGPGHYGHQLQNANAVDQLLVADFPNSTSALDVNFNGALSAGGLVISFDLDSVPTVYGGSPDNWGCVNLGMSAADKLANVNQGVPHFGILFRAAGTIQAFDGGAVVSPGAEPVYSTRAPGTYNHIDLVITDADGNPFDGIGSTIIEVFANGGPLPVYTFVKGGGGYANNYINLQGSFRAHFDNLTITQLPADRAPAFANPSFEVDNFTVFPGYTSQAGNGPITGWNALGGHGINPSGGSPFADNGTIPHGTKVAFLQEDGAMKQVVSGFNIGSTYQIRYFENARNCCNGTSPFAEVKVNGNTVVAPHAAPPVGGSNPYREIISDPFVATATAMEVAFIKSNPQGGDTTLVIDNVGFLAPNTPPTITSQPQGGAFGVGETIHLVVGAVGSAPLAYQWRLNGGDISGANSATYTIAAAAAGDAGTYSVRVSNGAGNIVSADAVIVVRDRVTTFFHTGVDSSGNALADGSVDEHYTLVLNPDSAAPTTFVQDSTVFPIVAGPWVANNAGSKWIGPRVETSGAAGATGAGGDYVYRTTVDLTGFDPATVSINGTWSTDNEGLDILVNGVSTGQRNTAQFPAFTPFTIGSGLLAVGLNTVEFRLNNAAAGYTGLRVDRVRALGTALPPGTAPFIVQQPASISRTLGERARFIVRANGSPSLTYQWYFGLDPVLDATGPELSFNFDFPDQAGQYSVEITSPFGTVRSAVAELVYRDVPLVISQPQSLAVAIGDSATFSVVANGEEPLEFQWTRNGADIPGANGPTLVIPAASLADAGVYAVRVSNFAGTDISDNATLSVLDRVPGLFNTGVGEDTISLPSGTVDPHWRITGSPDAGFPGPDAVVLNDTGFPIPPWLANDEVSKWIAPQANQGGGNLEGDYQYTTTFDLSGFDPATVVVTGDWATDNAGLDILINGTSTGQRNDGQFVVWTPFRVASGFTPGVNTLDFRVNNAPPGVNPTGFRVRNLRALGVRVPRPTIVCPGDIVAECGGGLTPVTFTATAQDAAGTPVPVVCTPPSGSGFALGATVVNCTAGAPGASSSCSFIVTVRDTTPPVVRCSDAITANATSAAGAVVTFVASASDACGIESLTCTPPSGSTFAIGVTTVTCIATDRAGNSASCSFQVTVMSDNRPPTAKITTDALVDFSPDFEHPVLISCNWWNACLILDGSLSSDPDGDALTYWWFVQPSTVPFAGGPVATNCLEVGTHTIVLTVTDPDGASHSDTLTIEEITAPLAIELLMEKVTESSLSRAIKRELLTVLRTALNQAGNERIRATQTTLDAFEKKVRAKVVGNHADLAASLIRWSQAISSGMEKCIKAPVVKKDYEYGKGEQVPN